ncbi:hypothetical protein JRO89_XS06G0185500 [Xanthoceras sorbifolium]|uniref:Uncharacterized protein n=1 Tax=Xanthoceras sorbifolium TaxID=99658 RepID=A0ABQ8HZ25_9ROSI|nr:hypothetical protein JRO89_XS06G0185500 [Xanthoceras sorbifolium]
MHVFGSTSLGSTVHRSTCESQIDRCQVDRPGVDMRVSGQHAGHRFSLFEEGIVLVQVNCGLWVHLQVIQILKFKADAFGWHFVPIKFKLRFNGEEERLKSVILNESYKDDEWHEIHGGSFTVSTNC